MSGGHLFDQSGSLTLSAFSIPAITGAAVLKLKDGLGDVNLAAALIGFGVALLSGYFALRWLVALVQARRFAAFAPYCAMLGIMAIVFTP